MCGPSWTPGPISILCTYPTVKDLTGTRLAHYDVVERLGGGGMAVVYRAVQQPLGREVALKALMPELVQDPEFVKRFETEARTLARLDHPNILPIYDFEITPTVAFLTMPLIRGGTLRDILNRGRLDTVTAWRILREIGDALQHAHEAGIVHRDLKPTNVLIHADGRALLADFGLARGFGQPMHLTTAGLAIGTPGYMAPEQVMGQDVDRRADIYAMGVLTFEMLTGRLPFSGANRMEVAYQTVNSPVPSAVALNPALPDELDQLLARVLAKDPAQRPQTIRELLMLMGRLPQRRATPYVAAAPPHPSPAPVPAPPLPAPAAVQLPVPATAIAAASPPFAAYQHGSPPPSVSAAGLGLPSAVKTLEQMGVKRARPKGRFTLNSHFSDWVHVARDVTAERWPEVAQSAALSQYIERDPPSDDQLGNPIENLSRLNQAFDLVFGAQAEDELKDWGRRATDRWLDQDNHGMGGRRGVGFVGRQRKLPLVIRAYSEAMDKVRGEHTHAWIQVDADQVWMVNYQNLFALGRPKTEKSCFVWTASIEAVLRWAGLANDWYVEEVECGCVTGSFDCVFAIRSANS